MKTLNTLALLMSTLAPTAFAASLSFVPDRALFLAAVGPAPLLTQDFESYATGTSLNGAEILPGVTISATQPTLQSFNLLGTQAAFATGRAGTSFFGYDLSFSGGVLALGLDLLAVDPATGPLTLSLLFAPGAGVFDQVDYVLPPSNPDESTPMFVGFRSDIPIIGLRVREGLELNSACCEEIALDNIMVQMAPVPEPGTWALLAGGLAAVGWRARHVQAVRRGG